MWGIGFNVTSLSANPDLDVRTAPDWEPFFVVGGAIEHNRNDKHLFFLVADKCFYNQESAIRGG